MESSHKVESPDIFKSRYESCFKNHAHFLFLEKLEIFFVSSVSRLPVICFIALVFGCLAQTPQTLASPESFPGDFYRTGSYNTNSFNVELASLTPQEIAYRVKLPDGSLFEIKSELNFPNRNFPKLTADDLTADAEYYRKSLEGFGRIIHSGSSFDYAALTEPANTIYTLEINQDYLKKKGLVQLDPAKLAFEVVTGKYSGPQSIKVDRVTFSLPDYSESVAAAKISKDFEAKVEPATERPKGMMKKTLQFLLDAMVISTARAWTTHKSGESEIRRTWDERGLQFGIKIEFMVGIGRINVARSMSVSFSIGYNRTNGSLVFRRGFRMEKMSDGSNLSIGGKVEIKRYRLNTTSAFDSANHHRQGYAKMSGQSWYPPMFLPVVSPVFETGRGYQSEGVSLAGNIADFGGSFLLNSVNAFEEAQRVYQTELPNPNRWFAQVFKSGGGFVHHHFGAVVPNARYSFISSPQSRCEMAFMTVP